MIPGARTDLSSFSDRFMQQNLEKNELFGLRRALWIHWIELLVHLPRGLSSTALSAHLSHGRMQVETFGIGNNYASNQICWLVLRTNSRTLWPWDNRDFPMDTCPGVLVREESGASEICAYDIGAVEESRDSSWVLHWCREIETLAGDDDDLLEDGRLIRILRRIRKSYSKKRCTLSDQSDWLWWGWQLKAEDSLVVEVHILISFIQNFLLQTKNISLDEEETGNNSEFPMEMAIYSLGGTCLQELFHDIFHSYDTNDLFTWKAREQFEIIVWKSSTS